MLKRCQGVSILSLTKGMHHSILIHKPSEHHTIASNHFSSDIERRIFFLCALSPTKHVRRGSNRGIRSVQFSATTKARGVGKDNTLIREVTCLIHSSSTEPFSFLQGKDRWSR